MNHVVAIVGPTGIGKSRLALHLAHIFNGEVVNADSRQIYRYMDIGTAKPSHDELSLIPHHLIDMINPDENFSLAQYRESAYQAIDDIQHRNKLPLLVGGSGQYVWAVLEGWSVPQVPPDPELRQALEEKAARAGAGELYNELVEVDPIAAQKIDRRNVRRVIRALEVHKKTNIPFSQLQRKEAPGFSALVIGLTADRAELYRRIDNRVDEMIERGLVTEVNNLLNMGCDSNLPSMSGIGYKEIEMYLGGRLTLASAIQQMKFETHRFVRHQYTWFRLKDDRIHWYDVQQRTGSEIEAALSEFINCA